MGEQNKKVEAIMGLRARLNCSLRAVKYAVDNYLTGGK